ncbi:centrosomal protein of 126 kDa isoform X1 [Bufo gargarizans]|uniref:centrosomal protein of 126 kDa isoform X1 n=1 Tax=Bufo gargarizans TaxID=30331 RepID=UPI001CF11F82|nr:centrosomal protein of 126 kDa isoform X1 [Bufo gargarizans]
MLNQRSRSYSNQKTQLEVDLEEDRQALLEDQRVIRQRARKLSVETNRRRKALEEKQREEEQREQKFREEVLQQRKLKLQEATEKFQRAHLPPSQRRRAVYTVHKRPTPKLEDALDQIQGSIPSTYYYVTNHRSPNGTRTSDSPSSLSSIGHFTWPRRQQPAAKLDLERIFHDRSTVQVDSNQFYFQHKLEEAQRLLEEQHLSNLQNFHQEVAQLTREDSLSSLDSLEGNLEPAKEENSSVFSSVPLHKALADISSSSVNMGYYNTDDGVRGFNSQTNLPEPSRPLPGDMIVEMRFPVGDEESVPQNGFQQKTMDTLTRNEKMHPVSTSNLSMSNQHVSQVSRVSGTESKLSYYDRDNASCNVVVRPSRAWATPDPTPKETIQMSVPHDNKDTPQHPGLSARPAMTQPLATPVVVPFSESSSNSFQYNISSDLKVSKHSDKIHSMSLVPDPEILTNIYNAQFHTIKTSHRKPEEINSRDSPLHQKRSSPTETDSGVIQDPKGHQNGTALSLNDPDLALSTLYRKARINTAGKEGKKLLKSILKKVSKYENGYTRVMGINKMVLRGDRASTGIRDSVELIKEKEHKKTNNKKLRWLDEIDKLMDNQGVPGMNGAMQATVKSSVESTAAAYSKENDLAHTTSQNGQTGPLAGTPSSVFSTGYHFAKQAWMVSKDEEPNSVGHMHTVRSSPKAKTRVVRRPKSARTPSSVVHRNRKGIIIRPQSATEASRIARSQGKIMTPHPPPRPASDNNNNREPVAKAQPVTISQINHSNNVVSSTNHVIIKDNMASQTMSHSSGNTQIPQAYVPSDPDNASKAALALNSERLLALQESLPVPVKRHPVFGENGLRLDHTPTDEEIAFLWQGVRSALTHKNAATGDFRAGVLPSHLQHTQPNLSHIVIDGATLSNWRSLSRINGFFSPLNNGYVTLSRRKPILDNNENKRRALLEQRKGRPASAGWGPSHIQNMNTVKINPLSGAHGPGQNHSATHPGEVSESTAQFILAENLVETSASDGEILAAMQEVQANKHSGVVYRAPQTALSIEEQRLLQSLDRLNQRLQHVQETTIKPSAATIGFPPKSALKIPHFPPQPAEHMTQAQKYRSLSADPRTRLQRRY